MNHKGLLGRRPSICWKATCATSCGTSATACGKTQGEPKIPGNVPPSFQLREYQQ